MEQITFTFAFHILVCKIYFNLILIQVLSILKKDNFIRVISIEFVLVLIISIGKGPTVNTEGEQRRATNQKYSQKLTAQFMVND